MSDSPYNFLPPDDAIALAQKTGRDLRNDALRLGSGFVTNVGPDPRLTQGMPYLPNIANYVPFTGLVENLSSMAGTGYDAIRTLVNKGLENAGYKETRLPEPWQWTQAAARHVAQTEDEVDKQLGADPVDITSPSDVIRSSIMHTVGSMLPAAPGKIVTSLPGAAGAVAKWLLPTTEHAAQNVLTAGALGTAGGAYEAHKAEQLIKDSGLTVQQARDALAAEDTAQTAPPEASALNATPATPTTTAAPAPTQAPAQVKTLDEILGSTTQTPSTRVDTSKVQTLDQILGTTPATPSGGVPTFDEVLGTQVAPTFQEGGGYHPMTTGDALVVGLLGVAGLGAARVFHGLGAETTAAARLRRLQDPEFVARAQKFNNELIAQGRSLSVDPHEGLPEPPHPTANPLRTAVTAVQDTLLDHTAKSREFMSITAQTPSSVDLLSRRYGVVRNDAMHQATAREFMETGFDDHIDFQMTHAPAPFYREVAALPNDKEFTLREALIARNEKRNRINNQIDYGNPLPLDFKDKTMADLTTIEQRATSDPVLMQLIEKYDTINREIPQMGLQYGHFTQGEVNDMLKRRPEVVFDVDPRGRILGTFRARQMQPYTGIDKAFTTPYHSQAQHVEQAFREFRVNQFNKDLYNHVESLMASSPDVPRYQTRKMTPNQPQYGILPEDVHTSREPIVYIRDNGIKAIHVHDPLLYETYTGQNTTRQRATLGGLAAISRMFAHTTTGVASIATGRIFPFRPALWTALSMNVNKPKGSVIGLGDLVAQRLGGSYRGFDPTNLGGMAYAYGKGRVEAGAGLVGQMLRKDSPNLVNRFMRATVGDVQTDKMQGVLERYYMDSFIHFKRASGMGGQANMFRVPLPAYSAGKGTPIRSVFNELVPELFMANTWAGRARPPVVKIRSALEQFYSNMSEASHDYFARLNRDRGQYKGQPELLAYDTRALTGDPGVGGGNRYVQGFTGAVPYSNIAMQGASRRVRALVDAPVAASLAYASSVGSLALLSLLTGLGRQDAIDYMDKVLSTTQRVSDVILFRNGHAPEAHIKIPLAQEDSWAYGLALNLIANAMNLAAIKHMPDTMAAWGDFIHDYMREHLAVSTMESMEHGIQRGVGLDWPLLNAAFALTGKELHVDVARVMDAIRNGTFGTDTFFRGTGSAPTTPNHPGGDGTFDSVEGKKFTDVVSNIFGMVGGMMDIVNNTGGYWKQTGDFWRAMGMAGHDWLQQAKDLNPQGNTLLWENAVSNSFAPPIVEYNQQRMAAMKLTAGMRSDVAMEGTTGGPRAFALPVPPSAGEDKVPTDPQMADLYQRTGQLHSFLESHVLAEADAIKKQIAQVSAQGLPPEQKREWTNTQKRKYADVWRTAGGFIDDLNAEYSQKFGRYVDVGKKVDWHGGVDQFPPITQ